MALNGVIESRGLLYEVSLSPGSDSVRVRVRLNGASWANTFNATYLDELTKKTGSHRDFNTFVNMLAAALANQGSGECSLQLLSPADLDALRTNTNTRQNRPVGDRRYLLLVYQTTFEKTHYPLSLLPEAIPQQFAPSSIATATVNTRLGNGEELHSIVKQLQDEIRRLKQPDEPNYRSKYESLVLEHKELQNQLKCLSDEIKTSQNTKHQRQMRKLVDEMENAMNAEKARCKKTVAQKSARIRELESEMSELKTKNKSLDIRVRALTTELQTYKRGRTGGRFQKSYHQSRESSRERQSRQNSRQNSMERRVPRKNRPPVYRSTVSSRLSQHSRSRDPSPCGSVRSRGSVASIRSNGSVGSNKSTGSRNGSRKRFDPTAYIKAKKAKEKDSQRRIKRSKTPTLHSRDNSYNSKVSRKSSIRTRSSTPDPNLLDSYDSDRLVDDSLIRNDSLLHSGSFNIAEIDARLSALQQYMNDLATN